MKKFYSIPLAEIIEYRHDVITTSEGGEEGKTCTGGTVESDPL